MPNLCLPPRDHNLSIPLPLERVVLKAMCKEVSGRYKNVSEMIEELEAVLNDPSRETVIKDETLGIQDEAGDEMDGGMTIKMPAVKLNEKLKEAKAEKEVKEEKEVEKTMSRERTSNKRPVSKVDKRKERKVITVAIICAVAVILLISAAFLSITGLGGMIMGSKTVEIPDLEGMLYEEAIEKFVDIDDENAEYKFNIIRAKTVESKKEAGTILSQDPEAGSKIKMKEVIVINVEISGGSSDVVLKNYTRYKDSREVEIEINGLGLTAEFEEEFSDTIPTGSIIRQEPASGTTVKKGDKILFFVSKGPEDGEKKEDEPSNSGGETNKNDEPVVEKPPVQKKSTMLTLYGPKNKESALVQVSVNGSNVYSKNIKKGESDVVKLEGTSSTVTVEIFHDGISQQKSVVKLH